MNKTKCIDEKLYKKCVHDIKNMILIDNEMFENIHNMSDKQKIGIILIYDDVVKVLKEAIE